VGKPLGLPADLKLSLVGHKQNWLRPKRALPNRRAIDIAAIDRSNRAFGARNRKLFEVHGILVKGNFYSTTIK